MHGEERRASPVLDDEEDDRRHGHAIDKSGLKYKLGAMQTTVEGDDAEVMALILHCHRHMRAKARRVVTHIAIDDREGASRRLKGKVADVEKALGRKLSRE